jgi:hypothetical protein
LCQAAPGGPPIHDSEGKVVVDVVAFANAFSAMTDSEKARVCIEFEANHSWYKNAHGEGIYRAWVEEEAHKRCLLAVDGGHRIVLVTTIQHITQLNALVVFWSSLEVLRNDAGGALFGHALLLLRVSLPCASQAILHTHFVYRPFFHAQLQIMPLTRLEGQRLPSICSSWAKCVVPSSASLTRES